MIIPVSGEMTKWYVKYFSYKIHTFFLKQLNNAKNKQMLSDMCVDDPQYETNVYNFLPNTFVIHITQ